VTNDEPAADDPESAGYAFWYWVALLIGLFMGLVVVMALIATHAN
jgi:hypothetical protein